VRSARLRERTDTLPFVRRVAVVLALISSSIACGGFLGFGDDDDDTEVRPTDDGGSEGGGPSNADGGFAPKEICETRNVVLGTDAGIAGSDWSKGINTSTGGGKLYVDGGVLVSTTGDGDAGGRAEATLFATRSGDLTRIACKLRVASSSFADKGSLLQIRIEGPKLSGNYDLRVDWGSGGLFRAVFQGTPDGGTAFSNFDQFDSPPAVDTMHDLKVDLVMGERPSFDVTIADAGKRLSPPAMDPFTRTQVVIGTVADPPFVPHEVRYESVSCEMCVKP
jgi:hypothetical protein